MGEPAHKPEAVDELEVQVEAAIALCDGDGGVAGNAHLQSFPRTQARLFSQHDLGRLHAAQSVTCAEGQRED